MEDTRKHTGYTSMHYYEVFHYEARTTSWRESFKCIAILPLRVIILNNRNANEPCVDGFWPRNYRCRFGIIPVNEMQISLLLASE